MTRRRVKVFLGIASMFVLGVGVCGCDLLTYNTIPERQPDTGRPVASSYRFEDIPIPPGMNLVRKESFIYETKDSKTGLLVYEGKGEMEKLVLFLKQQMPKYKWRLISNFELHSVMLSFIKEGWIGVITIASNEQDVKRLEVRVGPVDLKCQ